MRALLRDVVNAKDASVRFAHDEVPITEQMKSDLAVMLDALDAISGP